MAEENQARRRKGGDEKNSHNSSSNGDNKKQERPKPFQGRYNPKASDRYGMLSHKSLAKFVMLFGVVFFLLYSNYRKESVQCIAKVTETLEKTRSVSMLCSPTYKA